MSASLPSGPGVSRTGLWPAATRRAEERVLDTPGPEGSQSTMDLRAGSLLKKVGRAPVPDLAATAPYGFARSYGFARTESWEVTICHLPARRSQVSVQMRLRRDPSFFTAVSPPWAMATSGVGKRMWT